MSNSELLKQIWLSLYDPKIEIADTIEKFFHAEYEQCINGVKMNRSAYIQHVIEQRKNMTIDAINYKIILEKENELFSIYFPKGKNKKGDLIEAEVIAYFRFEDHKIIEIHGQVRLINGDASDVDMKN